MMSDARLSGLDIVALVAGHRTADGVLWQPGTSGCELSANSTALMPSFS
ncbi:hypothetical protein O5699_25615 [Escherichia coli]|nr:hypothetical protein [Escherichia coli]